MTERDFPKQKQKSIYQKTILQNCAAMYKVLGVQPPITTLIGLTSNVGLLKSVKIKENCFKCCQTILDGFVSISKVCCLLQPSQQNHTLADSQAVIPGITHR